MSIIRRMLRAWVRKKEAEAQEQLERERLSARMKQDLDDLEASRIMPLAGPLGGPGIFDDPLNAEARLEGAIWNAENESNIMADIQAAIARMKRPYPYRPPALLVHASTKCSLDLIFGQPLARPIDYDSWKDPAHVKRPLRCVVCREPLSRNCAKRWGNPYCGPHWPGAEEYKLKTRRRRYHVSDADPFTWAEWKSMHPEAQLSPRAQRARKQREAENNLREITRAYERPGILNPEIVKWSAPWW